MFDQALNAIYSAAAVPETWRAALDAIARCYESVGTALLLSRADRHLCSIVSPSLAAAARDYDDWGCKLDICVDRARERTVTAPNAFFTDRCLATPDEIASHPFFTRFRARHGLGPFLGGQLIPAPGVFAVISLQGHVDRAPYGEEEIACFARTARHVERALMLTIKLLEAEAVNDTFVEALSRLSCGVFLLDSGQRPVFANAAGKRMLRARLFGRGANPAAKGSLKKLFEEAVAAALSGSNTPSKTIAPILLPADEESGAIALYVMPLGRTHHSPLREVFVTAKVLILALEHNTVQPVDPLLIRDLLGLSQGEARLASLVGIGKSPREAAEQIGITEESARTVLKRVFLKTKTCKQSELAVLLSRLALIRPL